MLRAVIFDMGNTLLRFPRFGNGTWREAESLGIRDIYRYLIEQGHPITTHEDEFFEAMFARLAEGWEQSTGGHINLRAGDWIASAATEHGLTIDELVLNEAIRRYARPHREGLMPTPGAGETLAALREQGYRIGLISNTIWPGELHLEDLDQHGLLQYLEHTIFSGDLGIWKPDPRVFQHAMAALHVSPQESVFVGDSPREDIVGAKRAGMRAVWVSSTEFPLHDVQPDAIIDSPPDLLPILERWRV